MQWRYWLWKRWRLVSGEWFLPYKYNFLAAAARRYVRAKPERLSRIKPKSIIPKRDDIDEEVKRLLRLALQNHGRTNLIEILGVLSRA